MRVHYLQHVPFEGVGAIGEWARSRAYVLTSTEMFQRQGLDRSPIAARPAPHPEAPPVALNAPDPPSLVFPESEDLDFLIVMGGPMNVYQEAQNPWLPAEKGFIASMIAAGKLVLGVCLGAQLGGGRTRRPGVEGTTIPRSDGTRYTSRRPVARSRCSQNSRQASRLFTGTGTPSPSLPAPSTSRRRKPAPIRPSPTTAAESSDCSFTWRRHRIRWRC